MKNYLEQLSTRKSPALLASIGAGVLAGSVVAYNLSPYYNNAVRNFDEQYTETGRCLHDTPYDPDNGAIINVNLDKSSQQQTLSVLPVDANSHSPAVLFFTVENGRLGTFADHQTGALLVRDQCINANSGQ